MFYEAMPLVQRLWNPKAAGSDQVVTLDFDDNDVMLDENGQSPCIAMGFSDWTVPGIPHTYFCRIWPFCVAKSQTKTLYGRQGCYLALAHELGHALGGLHPAQNGRPLHGGGPVLCAWSSDCQDPSMQDYTAEDVALICNDGGHGGRCHD